MNKCDFCPNAHLENGKLQCPHSVCLLSKEDILKIANAIGNTKNKK